MEGTRNEIVSVGTSSVIVSPINPNRQVYSIVNSSTGGQVITVVLGNQVAVAAAGQPLSVGGNITDSDNGYLPSDYQCWKGQITAISDLAGGQLSVFER